MKVDTSMMLEVADRDRILHKLYKEQSFIEFCTSEQHFEQLANSVHRDWLQSGTCLKVTDDDITIARICWAVDKGYCE